MISVTIDDDGHHFLAFVAGMDNAGELLVVPQGTTEMEIPGRREGGHAEATLFQQAKDH